MRDIRDEMYDKADWVTNERDEKGVGKSWFPIRVIYDGESETKLVMRPEDLRSDKSFVVKKTRVVL